jgi:hypothetical protein
MRYLAARNVANGSEAMMQTRRHPRATWGHSPGGSGP